MFHTAGSKPNGARQSRQASATIDNVTPGWATVRHFLATWLALAAGFASEPITGRWFTAVVTIFGQPPF